MAIKIADMYCYQLNYIVISKLIDYKHLVENQERKIFKLRFNFRH